MDYFEALSEMADLNPELVFNNNGYERLSHEVVERNKEAITEIEKILKECVSGFVSFQNFKPRKDGTMAVRCQTRWSDWFIGVSYFPLEDFKPSSETWSEPT
jgi:hypothetical protein